MIRAFVLVDLSRNFGKEAAMTAGLDMCDADAAIPIDVDLQDPPHVIPQLIEKWREGFEVVLAKRSDRSSDGFMKHRSASLFYRIHNMIAAQKIPHDVGDFRLIDRQVIDALRALPERRRFMKGCSPGSASARRRSNMCARRGPPGARNFRAGSSGTSRSKASPASPARRWRSGPMSARPYRSSLSSTGW